MTDMYVPSQPERLPLKADAEYLQDAALGALRLAEKRGAHYQTTAEIFSRLGNNGITYELIGFLADRALEGKAVYDVLLADNSHHVNTGSIRIAEI